jgi:hypothetical protein
VRERSEGPSGSKIFVLGGSGLGQLKNISEIRCAIEVSLKSEELVNYRRLRQRLGPNLEDQSKT